MSGINVNIVDDPPIRHHSKRAFIQRQAVRERSRLKCSQLKIQLAAMLQREHKATPEEIAIIEKQISHHQSKCEAVLPKNFSEILQRLLQNHNAALPNHGTIHYLQDSKCQADIILAKRANEWKSDAIISNDGDFAAHLGNKGLFVKEFKYHSHGKTFSDIVLSTACATSLVKWLDEGRITKPRFPVFDGVDSPLVRALTAVAIGCDVWPGGIKDVGASKVMTEVQQLLKLPLEADLAQIFASHLVKYKTSAVKDPYVLICFAQALMYEKCSEGYVHSSPVTLDALKRSITSQLVYLSRI
jgi:hypothetical protein